MLRNINEERQAFWNVPREERRRGSKRKGEWERVGGLFDILFLSACSLLFRGFFFLRHSGLIGGSREREREKGHFGWGMRVGRSPSWGVDEEWEQAGGAAAEGGETRRCQSGGDKNMGTQRCTTSCVMPLSSSPRYTHTHMERTHSQTQPSQAEPKKNGTPLAGVGTWGEGERGGLQNEEHLYGTQPRKCLVRRNHIASADTS